MKVICALIAIALTIMTVVNVYIITGMIASAIIVVPFILPLWYKLIKTISELK